MTRQQRWAREALEHIKRIATQGTAEQKRYATVCMKGPSLIKQCGLIQTLSFLRVKGDADPGWTYCDHLAQVYLGQATGERLLQCALETSNLGDYMAMTRELTQVAMWFRRFAQSELKAFDGDE